MSGDARNAPIMPALVPAMPATSLEFCKEQHLAGYDWMFNVDHLQQVDPSTTACMEYPVKRQTSVLLACSSAYVLCSHLNLAESRS